MMAAALAAIVCDRLRIPRLLGFIGAGFVIGPHALPIPLVANICEPATSFYAKPVLCRKTNFLFALNQ